MRSAFSRLDYGSLTLRPVVLLALLSELTRLAPSQRGRLHPGFRRFGHPPRRRISLQCQLGNLHWQDFHLLDHQLASLHYPKALNPAGEPAFHRLSSSPSVNGLNPGLLSHNPNLHAPFRLDRSQNYTCDQDHDYMPEQQAFDNGLMDKFVQFAGVGGPGCPDYGLGQRW